MPLTHSVATEKGLRPYQEDRFFIQKFPTGTLAAIMDGHGGASCADKVRILLPLYWQALDTEELKNDPELRLLRLFDSLAVNTDDIPSGTTLSVVFIPNDEKKVHVAILGDSSVYINSGGNLHKSPEHNVRVNKTEREAAIAKGGYYDMGYIFAPTGQDGLQMSRTLGDKWLKKILNRVPEIYTVNLVPECYIILATDGLVDPSHLSVTSAHDDLASMINLVDTGHGAQELVDLAIERETGDNVTAIVIRVLKGSIDENVGDSGPNGDENISRD